MKPTVMGLTAASASRGSKAKTLPAAKTLLVLDRNSRREKRRFEDIGHLPFFILSIYPARRRDRGLPRPPPGRPISTDLVGVQGNGSESWNLRGGRQIPRFASVPL